MNIDFASEQTSIPQNGSDQASKVAESSPEKPKVKQIPPEFIIKPRRQLGDEGETAKFKASFDGSPEPELSWEFKGKVLANGSKYKVSSAERESDLFQENILSSCSLSYMEF